MIVVLQQAFYILHNNKLTNATYVHTSYMYQPRHFPSCTNRKLIVRDNIIHYSFVCYSIAVICSSDKIIAPPTPRIDLFIKMCTVCIQINNQEQDTSMKGLINNSKPIHKSFVHTAHSLLI